MGATRVLVLGSYPILHPRHGGQIRLSQIVAEYRARGLRVHYASWFQADPFYTGPGTGPLDAALPLADLQHWQGRHAPFMEDMLSGERAAQDVRRITALERAVGEVDVVHLEQPWLLPLVRVLRQRGRLGAFRLVYGSQNVEHPLKRAILAQHGVVDAGLLVEAVEALERACAQEANCVAAVTPEDAQVLRGWTDAPVVLAPNGVAPWRGTQAQRQRWLERLGPDPFGLYVASAHRPNIVGFGESFGASLAGLAPTQKIVLAGHAGRFILETDWFKRWDDLNRRRVVHVGLLDEPELSALRELAHTFILPVTSGGGSNLKTAEALYSGAHVVATPLALRGFEDWAGLDGLAVAEPGPAFAAATCRSLQMPKLASDDQARERRRTLTWSCTLAALCNAIESRPQ